MHNTHTKKNIHAVHSVQECVKQVTPSPVCKHTYITYKTYIHTYIHTNVPRHAADSNLHEMITCILYTHTCIRTYIHTHTHIQPLHAMLLTGTCMR